MPNVFITLKYEEKKTELAVPVDVPVSILTDAIAKAVGFNYQPGAQVSLFFRDGKKRFVLDPALTLLESGIMYGAILELVTGHVTGKLTMPLPTQLAYIQHEDGNKFQLNLQVTRLGRWAPGNEVDVDLTKFDPHKLVSRQHVEIRGESNHYLVIDQSFNGTWLNGQKLDKGTAYPLNNRDLLILGGSQGVPLLFLLGE